MPELNKNRTLFSGGLEKEGGVTLVWSQNVNGFEPDRSGNKNLPCFRKSREQGVGHIRIRNYNFARGVFPTWFVYKTS